MQDKKTATKQETLQQKLINIQQKLKVPKDKKNTFANFNYRSAESILQTVKPLLKENNVTLVMHDEIVEVGGRIYVKAIVTLNDNELKISSQAFAREEETKKGMDAAQITGSASSYARKYALSGLFAIDDGNDPDAGDNRGQYKMPVNKPTQTNTNLVNSSQLAAMFASMKSKGFEDKDQVKRILRNFSGVKSLTEIKKIDVSDILTSLKEATKEDLKQFDIHEELGDE